MTTGTEKACKLGCLVTTLDLSGPDLCYHDPPKARRTRSMNACDIENSDEWFEDAVSRNDIDTKETRRWIENAVERGSTIFLIVGYDGKTIDSVRLRKVLHRQLSSSDTALHQLSSPWWTSSAVYKCVGWLEDHDIIQVMLTDDLSGDWHVKEMD
jgi:hypothetical protein